MHGSVGSELAKAKKKAVRSSIRRRCPVTPGNGEGAGGTAGSPAHECECGSGPYGPDEQLTLSQHLRRFGCEPRAKLRGQGRPTSTGTAERGSFRRESEDVDAWTSSA